MKTKPTTTQADVYTRVTDRIIADLEKGVKPWTATNANPRIILPVRHNGIPYKGVNILLLWGASIEHGYQSNRWMTFKQAQELGANVRKGEHGHLVVYANKITKTEAGEDGEEGERQIAFMKGYTVFKVDQIENLPAEYLTRPEPEHLPAEKPLQLLEYVEEFFARTGAPSAMAGIRPPPASI